jgi:hypothetical protein
VRATAMRRRVELPSSLPPAFFDASRVQRLKLVRCAAPRWHGSSIATQAGQARTAAYHLQLVLRPRRQLLQRTAHREIVCKSTHTCRTPCGWLVRVVLATRACCGRGCACVLVRAAPSACFQGLATLCLWGAVRLRIELWQTNTPTRTPHEQCSTWFRRLA